jgi:hypothetical protein
MQKVRLAMLIGDDVHRNRLSMHMMQYEKDRFELHIFTDAVQLEEDQKQYDVVLCSDCLKEVASVAAKRKEPFVYLLDGDSGEVVLDEYRKRLRFIEKYQNINRIVDAVLKEAGCETRQVSESVHMFSAARMIAVYALAENEYQLPFLVTLASVLGEQHRVLILDLQENSGFTRLIGEAPESGLEDVFAMAESGRYSRNRLLNCIGHLEQADYIYPAKNTECLCEADSGMYSRLLQMLGEEQEYSVILLNLGSRFSGFFEILSQCQNIYLLTKSGGLCQWRENELMDEIEKRGYEKLCEKIVKVEIPIMAVPTSCERLVEQWKWNELGDMIRRMLLQPMRTEGAGI